MLGCEFFDSFVIFLSCFLECFGFEFGLLECFLAFSFFHAGLDAGLDA